MRWERVEVVCVVCPGCGFTFDADHTDDNDIGGYSCPECGEDGGE